MEEIINEPNHIMVLKAIEELMFNVGRKFLTEILVGEETERVLKHKFNKNKYFGCLAFTENEVQNFLSEMEFKKYIEIKKPDPNKFYMVICLTEIGKKEIVGDNEITPDKIQLKGEEVSEEDKEKFLLLGNFLNGLNDFQKKAVIDPSKKILCIAGAGTGKTTVLTKRIEFLSRLKNIDDNKILAITFTRKARKEMIERLDKLIPGNNFQIETFNSFCEKMLIRNGHLIYNKTYNVLDFRKKILLINNILKEIGHTPESAVDLYYSHKKYISEDKKTLYLRFINDLFAVMDHYRNMKKDFKDLSDVVGNIDPADKEVAMLVLKAVESIMKYKKELGYRDYTDQIVHVMKLFSDFPECIPKFEHVLVDEYQDVNNIQIALLSYLNAENLFAVGDPRQSIFGWRGSNITHITGFKEEHPESKILELKINYRSKESIIKILNSIISPMKMPDINCFENNKSSKKNVFLFEHSSEEKEQLFVVQSILGLKVEKRKVFVLARTNRQLEKMAEKLKKAHINFIKRTVEEKKVNIEAKENQITLSTVHAIKGLEAEVVYIIGANSFSFPCRASEHPILDILKTNNGYDKYEEELRVLYVALSRAKSKLIINYYSTLTPFIDNKIINDIGEGAVNVSGNLVKNEKIKVSGSNLFNTLKGWRLEESRRLNVKAFQVFSDRTLMEICQSNPCVIEDLYDIHGIGPAKVRRFGDDVLRMVLENGV